MCLPWEWKSWVCWLRLTCIHDIQCISKCIMLLPRTLTLMITFSFAPQAKFSSKFKPLPTNNTIHADVSWCRIQFCWLGWKCKRTSVCRVAKGRWWLCMPTPGKLSLALITMIWHDCIFFRHHMILANKRVSENYTPSAETFLNAREVTWSVLWAVSKKGANPDHVLFQSKSYRMHCTYLFLLNHCEFLTCSPQLHVAPECCRWGWWVF